MPFLGSKRRKTEPSTQEAQENSHDPAERTLSVGTNGTQNGPKSAPLRTKASSPNLPARTTLDGNTRPGLNRNFSKSWYGSWNGKASPTAEIARESISVAGGLTSESSSSPNQQSSTGYMHNSLRRPRKSVPLVAEATRVNATGSSTDADKRLKTPSTPVVEKADSPTQSKKSEETLRSETQPTELPKDVVVEDAPQMKQTPVTGAWFGWWSRPDGYAPSDTGKSKDGEDNNAKPDDKPQATAAPSANTSERPLAEQPDTSKPRPSFTSEMAERPPEPPSRAWFGLWSASQNQKVPSTSTEGEPSKPQDTQQEGPASTVDGAAEETAAMSKKTTDNNRARAESEARPKSSGWAFWSKDNTGEQKPNSDGTQRHLGEIAVADTPSQSHPEAAQFNAEPENKGKQKESSQNTKTTTSKLSKTDKLNGEETTVKADAKGNKQVKKTLLVDKAFATSAKSASTTSLPLPDMPPSTDVKKEEVKATPATKALKAQQQQPNMIEPQFYSTYPKTRQSTYWETLSQFLAYPLGLTPSVPPAPQHVSISPQKPKIKNAIAIGVHGYFPAPLVQKIIGQPTGTSIRFASHAAAAVRAWVEKYQPDTPCEVEQVALEGEGFISDRVSTLWKLLLNWLTHLRNADFILVAAHSQGVPVAVMLVAKLIQLGCLNPNAKLAICAMAGVNLGPFADYKSRFFGGSAAELFEFSRPGSRVSREYASAVDIILRHGVRVTYVGSLDDQLVSLEVSALVTPFCQLS